MRALALAAMTVVAAASAAEIAPIDQRSGYEFAGPETRAMQDDDTANPGMLWVAQGESLWGTKAGAVARSCADCHGNAQTSMKGVAARYPAFDAALAALSIWSSGSTAAAPSINRPNASPGKAPSCWL